MSRQDVNWFYSRLDVALDRASTVRQMSATAHDAMTKYKWRLKKGETLDPAEIERYGKQLKMDCTAMLQSFGALQAAMTNAFPNEQEEKEKRPA